jgi:hypothetical protein
MALQREVTDAEDKLKRLYRLVEDGMADLDDILKDRLNNLKGERDRAKAALEAAKSQIAPAIPIDPAIIERFGRSMRERFTSGSVPFRKAYLQSLIDVVEVDDHQIRVKGSKDVLERAVLASQTAGGSGSQMSTNGGRQNFRSAPGSAPGKRKINCPGLDSVGLPRSPPSYRACVRHRPQVVSWAPIRRKATMRPFNDEIAV